MSQEGSPTMRSRYLALAVISAALCGAGPAAADVILSDNFNRADSDTVGNGWVEVGGGSSDVRIISNQLELAGNGTRSATEGSLTLSTVGLTAITLDYD